MKRIVIVGSIASGKSTLARALGENLDREVIELDELWWQPGSYQRTAATAKTRTMERERWRHVNQKVADDETWIIDGSLDLLAIRLARADTVIFVDLPRLVCMWRVVRRSCASLRSDSADLRGAIGWLWVLLRWIWRYPQKRGWILSQIADHAATADIIRLRNRSQVQAFLRGVAPNRNGGELRPARS